MNNTPTKEVLDLAEKLQKDFTDYLQRNEDSQCFMPDSTKNLLWTFEKLAEYELRIHALEMQNSTIMDALIDLQKPKI